VGSFVTPRAASQAAFCTFFRLAETAEKSKKNAMSRRYTNSFHSAFMGVHRQPHALAFFSSLPAKARQRRHPTVKSAQIMPV
jgi:hypothetical protein